MRSDILEFGPEGELAEDETFGDLETFGEFEEDFGELEGDYEFDTEDSEGGDGLEWEAVSDEDWEIEDGGVDEADPGVPVATVDPRTEIDLVRAAADYQIIGKDTRKRITNTARVPFGHVCKLVPGCTGALIAPNRVLTAAHCVYSRSQRKVRRITRVIPGKNGPNQPYGWAKPTKVRYPRGFRTAPTYGQAWPHDYAVIHLDRSIGRKAGWFRRIRVIPSRTLMKLSLNTAGFPGDKGGQHMYWTFDRVVNANGPRIEYLHDTYKGQSGSPVWIRSGNARAIVAIHVARDDPQTPPVANRGVAMTPAVVAAIRRMMQ